MDTPENIEINTNFSHALSVLEDTRKSVFITGKAGTGKSTLLSYFRHKTKKQIVVLAPTGVAALNVGGQTIHSFCGFKTDVTLESIKSMRLKKSKQELLHKLDMIVIDEVSMLRADLMDCIDAFLRKFGMAHNLPFGGMQMVFIGDLYQLPPVVTSQDKHTFSKLYPSPWFFSAHVFSKLSLEFIELEKIYRQTDERFIRILNGIRNRSISGDDMVLLNQRVQRDFESYDLTITLTTTNKKADEINKKHLDKLSSTSRKYTGHIDGEFNEKQLPADKYLELKPGAQVMLLNNDKRGRWVNGSLGTIELTLPNSIVVILENGKEVVVEPAQWEMFEYKLDTKHKKLTTDLIGTYDQIPVRLAWAVTIHKSQGKTFDKVIIDFERGTFESGQAYVALSRCRTLTGITLLQPIKPHYILLDFRVMQFLTSLQYSIHNELQSPEEKLQKLTDAIENHEQVKIVYLKAKDEKSQRIISPKELGEMEFKGHLFLGLNAYCHDRNEFRVFNVERILKISSVE